MIIDPSPGSCLSGSTNRRSILPLWLLLWTTFFHADSDARSTESNQLIGPMSILYSLIGVYLLLVLSLYPSPSLTLENPCNYCKFCTYCSECSQCPCTGQALCDMCKYCSYCKYCTLCSVCDSGIANWLTGGVSNWFGGKNIEVPEDIKNVDLNKLEEELKKTRANRKNKEDL